MQIRELRTHRLGIWQQLKDASADGTGDGLSASLVNELGAYYGGRGIWRDVAKTGGNFAIGILHAGARYADDLDVNGGLFHYPVTDQPTNDERDIEATKNCLRNRLPIFVVVKAGNRRNVRLGWVTGWNDRSQFFAVECQEQPADIVDDTNLNDEPFEITSPRRRGRTRSIRRGGDQGRFRLKGHRPLRREMCS